MIKCKHWLDCGVSGGGCCGIAKYDRPSFGVCLKICNKNTDPQPKGLGDTISNVINKVSRGKVTPCGGCKKRQNKLNEIFPYKDKNNGN